MASIAGVTLPAWVPGWGPWAALGLAAVGVLIAVRSSLEGGGGSGGAGGDGGGGDAFGGLPVDGWAARDTTQAGDCSPTAKPGVVAFRAWAIDQWGAVMSPKVQNILRDCSVGGPSEHWEGRAWDLMTRDQAHGDEVTAALTGPGPSGVEGELARRAGIMNMIWRGRIWRAYEHAGAPPGTWGAYTGANPHTDHVHISFGWPGANGETSLYTSGVAPVEGFA